MDTVSHFIGRHLFAMGALTLAGLAIPDRAAVSAGPEARQAVGTGCSTAEVQRISAEPGWRERQTEAARTPDPSLARGTPAQTAGVVPESLVRDLVEWIGANTGYQVSDILERPPKISVVVEGTRIAYEGRELDLGSTLRATYDAYSRDIYLKCPWNADDTLDRSTLLHELVHDVQYRNRYWPCHREAEWEAYQLQAAWIEERGEQLEFNWLPAVLLSGCLRDVHP